MLTIYCHIGYRVEKRCTRLNGDWQSVGDYNSCQTRVDNLKNDEEYEFRVAAITEATGVGNFSLSTAPIVIKDKNGLLYL